MCCSCVPASCRDRHSDNFVSAVCSFGLGLFLSAASFYKFAALTAVPEVGQKLSDELTEIYVLETTGLTYALAGSVICAVAAAALVINVQFAVEQRRRRLEVLAGRARRLRNIIDGVEVDAPPIPDGGYHMFLSHVWGTGQDQMRIIKQRLLEMVPELSVFLDVDVRSHRPAYRSAPCPRVHVPSLPRCRTSRTSPTFKAILIVRTPSSSTAQTATLTRRTA